MRKQTLILTVLTAILLSACGGSDKKNAQTPAQQQVKEQYQCPMKCTEEIFDKPGKCPVCEMDLEKVTNS